ncbi:MAG: PqqD family protein [Leptolyngbya sp.]|nr:PqqD family protein [Leptolyngbya sp.]
MMTFPAETRLSRHPDLMASDLSATETVMMDIDQGLYFGLENVAKDIWDYLATPHTVAELQHHLRETYAVDEQTLTTDLQTFLADLEKHRLICREA